jgi:hypothetical protein
VLERLYITPLLALAITGCGETTPVEEPNASAGGEESTGPNVPVTLFEEAGVWTMTIYTDAEGELLVAPLNTHENAFMLNFEPTAGVVATAACSFMDGSNIPGETSCRIGLGEDLGWECNCFAYEFEDDVMRWAEFSPGSEIPAVDPMTSSVITVADYAEVSNSYFFEPLPGPSPLDPDGLFGSNGSTDRFVFLQRYAGIFDETGCAEVCFQG